MTTAAVNAVFRGVILAFRPESRTIIPVANKHRDVTIPPLAHDLIIASIESEIALGCLGYTIVVLADKGPTLI
jgi:hypothetical protein